MPMTEPEAIAVPTLSLCMIVKDEEASLPRCLESVAGVVDEIVVVDTGSRDRTMEIAREYGARVVEWAWRDDFAAARNVSLDHASGDWILFLDADEELVAEDRQLLRETLDDSVHDGVFLLASSFAGERPGHDQVNHPTLRLFRNRHEYRFAGAIHEQIMPAILEHGGRLTHAKVHLRHYGYLDSAIKDQQKVARNLRIAQAEVRKRPNDPFALYNLGMEYLRIGDHAKALEVNRKAFLSLHDLTPSYASRLLRNLVTSLIALKRYKEALDVLEDAEQAYPGFTDLFYQEALIYLEQKDFSKAIKAFRTCLAKGEAEVKYLSDAGVGTYRAWFGLGNASEELGDYRTALESYEQALKSCPALPGAAHRLARILLKVAEPEIARVAVERLADLSHPGVLASLAVAFREARQYALALDYVRRASSLDPGPSLLALKAECELYCGEYEASAGTFSEILASPEPPQAALTFAALAQIMLGRPDIATELLKSAADVRGEGERARAFTQFAALLEGTPANLPRLEPGSEEYCQTSEAVWTLLAFLLERQEFEKFEVALALLDLLQPSPRDRHLQLGKLYHAFGFIGSAIEELAVLNPDELDAEAAEILGTICAERGSKADALPFLAAALERDAQNPRRYAVLALKAQDAGERELAAETARRGLAIFPDHPILKEVLVANTQQAAKREGLTCLDPRT